MEEELSIRIRVRGRLSERLVAAFDGLEASFREGATELTGTVADRSQLFSLITRVRDLGLELECVDVADTHPSDPGRRSR